MSQVSTVNNAQAINGANELVTLCQQCSQLSMRIQDHLGRAASQGWNGTWMQCTTTALNPDGTPGKQDGAPVLTNPLSRAVYPTLRATLSQAQLAAGESFLVALGTFLQTPGWQAILATMTGNN